MKKIAITITATAILGFSTIVSSVSAETVNNLETKQQDIKSERSSVKSNLTDAEKQVSSVLYELKDLDSKIERTSEALELNKSALTKVEGDIKENEKQINKLEDNIAKLEVQIENRFELLKDRLVSYQRSGGDIAFLDVLAGAQSFDDFVTRAKAVKTISDSDIKLMEGLEKDQNQVEKEKKSIDKKLKATKEKKNDLELVTQAVAAQKKQQETDKSSLVAKQTELENLKDSLQMKDSQLASLESQVSADIAAAQAPPVEVAVANTESSNENSVAQSASNNTSRNQASSSRSQATPNRTQASPSRPTASATPASPAKVSNKKPKAQQTSSPNYSGKGLSAISAGNTVKGTPYVWGGKKPGGFDCSGFVSWAYKQEGISLPSYTGALVNSGTRISLSQAKAGDLVFFDSSGSGKRAPNSHVGIYLGGGQFMGAQNSTGVANASMSSGYWKTAFNKNGGVVVRVK